MTHTPTLFAICVVEIHGQSGAKFKGVEAGTASPVLWRATTPMTLPVDESSAQLPSSGPTYTRHSTLLGTSMPGRPQGLNDKARWQRNRAPRNHKGCSPGGCSRRLRRHSCRYFCCLTSYGRPALYYESTSWNIYREEHLH